jgi:hypothetical protein
MKKTIIVAGLITAAAALSVTALAQTNWLLYLPAILAGSQGGQSPVTVMKLNDTGIVLNGSGGACEETSEEDCNYGRDKTVTEPTPPDGHAGFSFTKLAADGGVLAYDATSWACVRDNVTGLVWTDQAAWDVGDKKTWDTSQTYAVSFSDCGLSADWRVSTAKELINIVAYNESTQSADANFFHLPTLPVFWTGTENTDSLYAWSIDFNGGYLSSIAAKTNPLYVRLVHGAASSAQFQANVDDTVTDLSTGLIWKKCLEGYSGVDCTTAASTTTFTWSEALGLADSEWRLPNIKELQSIVEYQNSSPAINETIFPGTPSLSTVWSNSPMAELADNAWYIGFDSGYTVKGTESRHVRLVKDAPVAP